MTLDCVGIVDPVPVIAFVFVKHAY